VPITRLLKFNDTNVQLQKALMAHASAAASTSGSSSKGKAHGGGLMKDGSSSRGGGLGRKDGRGTKRGREEVRLFFIQICLVVYFLVALMSFL
jgi:mortality factor 4-like protein 1